jgi:glycine/serine hydroxymethyltransferase
VGDPYAELKKVIKEVQPDLIIVGGSLATAEMTMFSPPTVGMRIASIAKVSLLLAK